MLSRRPPDDSRDGDTLHLPGHTGIVLQGPHQPHAGTLRITISCTTCGQIHYVDLPTNTWISIDRRP